MITCNPMGEPTAFPLLPPPPPPPPPPQPGLVHCRRVYFPVLVSPMDLPLHDVPLSPQLLETYNAWCKVYGYRSAPPTKNNYAPVHFNAISFVLLCIIVSFSLLLPLVYKLLSLCTYNKICVYLIHQSEQIAVSVLTFRCSNFFVHTHAIICLYA